MDFTSVHNIHEQRIFDAVTAAAPGYPGVPAGLLPDVACVALNRVAPRYIRHAADLAFFATAEERSRTQREIGQAVSYAFEYVQARQAMRARA